MLVQMWNHDCWRSAAAWTRMPSACPAHVNSPFLCPITVSLFLAAVWCPGCRRHRGRFQRVAPSFPPYFCLTNHVVACVRLQVSGDLDEDDIGEPVMEFTLEVGF